MSENIFPAPATARFIQGDGPVSALAIRLLPSGQIEIERTAGPALSDQEVAALLRSAAESISPVAIVDDGENWWGARTGVRLHLWRKDLSAGYDDREPANAAWCGVRLTEKLSRRSDSQLCERCWTNRENAALKLKERQ